MGSGGLGVLDSGSLIHPRSRRNVGFWVEMGEKMDVEDLQRGVKKVLKYMLEGLDTLVHCVQGKHRSGGFLVFVLALISGNDADDMINDYLKKDPVLRRHDSGCVFRVWKESNLRTVLEKARQDSEVKHMASEIHLKMGLRTSWCLEVVEVEAPEDEASRGVRSRGVDKESRGVQTEVEASGRGVKRSSEDQQSQQAQKRAHLTSESSSDSTASRSQEVERPQGSAGSSPGQDVKVSATPQPTVGNYRFKPGDWQCRACGNWNYSSRWTCNFNACSHAYWKRGDWTCAECGNHNYASRTHCAMRRCQAPKP